ncbi:MAG: hypothetical protein HDR26_02955 [Lachnospiraceae bacterium]|nr:hypothetical protein [Lachnospiraceae bacterium]
MKKEIRVSKILICSITVAAFVMINGLFHMMNMREDGDRNTRYQQYIVSSIAGNVSSIEYIDTADVSILEDGENCQVEISVKMQDGQTLLAEDENAIKEMAETVLADQYSGDIIITFISAG